MSDSKKSCRSPHTPEGHVHIPHVFFSTCLRVPRAVLLHRYCSRSRCSAVQAGFMANAAAPGTTPRDLETATREGGSALHAATVVGDTVGDPSRIPRRGHEPRQQVHPRCSACSYVDLAVSLWRPSGPGLSRVAERRVLRAPWCSSCGPLRLRIGSGGHRPRRRRRFTGAAGAVAGGSSGRALRLAKGFDRRHGLDDLIRWAVRRLRHRLHGDGLLIVFSARGSCCHGRAGRGHLPATSGRSTSC